MIFEITEDQQRLFDVEFLCTLRDYGINPGSFELKRPEINNDFDGIWLSRTLEFRYEWAISGGPNYAYNFSFQLNNTEDDTLKMAAKRAANVIRNKLQPWYATALIDIHKIVYGEI